MFCVKTKSCLSKNSVHQPELALKSVIPVVTTIISGILMSLSRVDVVFLFWSLFPVFPGIQIVGCLFYSQSGFSGSHFLYSPRRQTFSDLFSKRFYWLLFG